MNFEACTDIVVIGRNPENADYTNPRGEIHGFAAFVEASTPRGDTKRFFVDSSWDEATVLEKAKTLAFALNNRFNRLGKLPIGFDNWVKGRPIYGSDAYIAYGQDDDVALEAREVEEESY